MGWTNAISLEHDAAIRAAILVGRNTGSIAHEFGVHRNSVVLRRRLIAGAAQPCSCGRPASHKGTCQPRLVAASTARPKRAFPRIRSWRPPTSINYVALSQHFRNRPLSPEELVVAVDSVIPKFLPRQVRDEARSEMLLAHLEGDLAIGDFGERCREFVTKVYGLFPDKGALVSLDAIHDHFNNNLYARIPASNYELEG